MPQPLDEYILRSGIMLCATRMSGSSSSRMGDTAEAKRTTGQPPSARPGNMPRFYGG